MAFARAMTASSVEAAAAARVVGGTRRAARVSAGRVVPRLVRTAALLDVDAGADLDFTADLSYEEFDQLLNNYEFGANVGDKVKGVVVSVEGNKGVHVDIGGKTSAWLPSQEVALTKIDKLTNYLAPGEEREFVIVKDDRRNPLGAMTLSLKSILMEQAWNNLRQKQADDEIVDAEVVGANRGGLMVVVEGVAGFIPSSQLVQMGTPQDREAMTGQVIQAKFLEVDEERERLVLSNRAAVAAESQEDFKVGDVVVGTVQAVKQYGAFVQIGSLSGLLHISQISHERLTAVENVLAPGDQLKVMILATDRERGRLSLSTKKLEPTPGDMLRNPALVFEKAEEMAATFRERVAAAEAAARAEEEQMQSAFAKPEAAAEPAAEE